VVTAAPGGLFSASVLDEDAAHRFRCGIVEVAAVIPFLCDLLVDEPHIGFVDERRWLKRMIRRLLRHPGCRQFPQFVINQRQQILRRRRIARFNLLQDLRDVADGDVQDMAAGRKSAATTIRLERRLLFPHCEV